MAVDGREAIIFLDNHSIQVYEDDKIFKYDIPTNIVRDFEVKDRSGFDTLLDTLIKNQKLTPANLWIVLADSVCFSTSIEKADQAKMDLDVKDFLEAIPFEEIVSKKYSVSTGIWIAATNLQTIEAVGEVFERNGFVFQGVVPTAIFANYSMAKVLDSKFAKIILANQSLMMSSNLLQRVESVKPIPQTAPAAPKKNNLLPYLLIGFGVLLAILIAMLALRKG